MIGLREQHKLISYEKLHQISLPVQHSIEGPMHANRVRQLGLESVDELVELEVDTVAFGDHLSKGLYSLKLHLTDGLVGQIDRMLSYVSDGLDVVFEFQIDSVEGRAIRVETVLNCIALTVDLFPQKTP